MKTWMWCFVSVSWGVCVMPGVASAQDRSEESYQLRGQGMLLDEANGGLATDAAESEGSRPAYTGEYIPNSRGWQLTLGMGAGLPLGVAGGVLGSIGGLGLCNAVGAAGALNGGFLTCLPTAVIGGALIGIVGYTGGFLLGSTWSGGALATDATRSAGVEGAIYGAGIAVAVGLGVGVLGSLGTSNGVGPVIGAVAGGATALLTVPVFSIKAYEAAYPARIEVTSVSPVMMDGGAGLALGGRF